MEKHVGVVDVVYTLRTAYALAEKSQKAGIQTSVRLATSRAQRCSRVTMYKH
jgi:hypothetical protein